MLSREKNWGEIVKEHSGIEKEPLLSAIHHALTFNVDQVEERYDGEKGFSFGAHVRSLTTVKSATREPLDLVMNALFKQESLHSLIGSSHEDGSHSMFSLYGSGGVGILPIKLAHWLLAKSLALPGGAIEAVDKLDSFLTSNSVEGMHVTVVAGIYISETIHLDDQISIFPIIDLPASLGRDSLVEFLSSMAQYLPRAGRTGAPALAAVVKRFEMRPATVPSLEKLPNWIGYHHSEFDQLATLAHALSLLDETKPQIVARWISTSEPDTIPGLTGGTMGDTDIASHVQKRFDRVDLSDSKEITQSMRAFLSFEERKELELPLERLSMFRTKRDFRDKALELGTALESFFMDVSSNSDLSHKIGVRGAIYSSNNRDQRLNNFKLLKAAYRLRSEVIHGTRVNPTKIVKGPLNMKGEDVLENTAKLLLNCIRKTLKSKKYPNWENVDLDVENDT